MSSSTYTSESQRKKRSREAEDAGSVPAPKKTAIDYLSMKPFVADYRPYTKGFGMNFKIDPVEKAEQMWNAYYSQNTTAGFKDRHYFAREVPEFGEAKVVMEIGCGVGNTVFPVLSTFPQIQRYHAYDLSKVAVQLLKKHESYQAGRVINAFQHDISSARLPPAVVPVASVDVATMIFVLSAIAPDKMQATVKNFSEAMAPGGLMYFRDYCDGDLAQQRFAEESKVEGHEGLYMRTCGTCSYFFKRDELLRLFAPYYTVEMCETVEREILNKKEDLTMNRVWIHAKFRRNNVSV
eukprot:Rhum_TRINITY_DN18588_c0_g1::Rhum_TRINITY_DN18588_c0_g1_i1::g.167706::m.167706/K00599/METTL6; methyltransferase-like protein 6